MSGALVNGVGFVAQPALTQLSAVMKALDAGDRVIKGRVELFSFAHRRMPRRWQEELERQEPDSFAASPLGPLASDTTQSLLINLTGLMTLLFGDYDCTSLTPSDFVRCDDKHAVVSTINHNLAAVVDRIHGSFQDELWHAVQESINLNMCVVYALNPRPGSFEPADKALMSFFYFFVDEARGRILFIGGMAKSRSSFNDAGSESEVLSEDNGSKSSKSMGESSIQEGEYFFNSESDSEDAAMAD